MRAATDARDAEYIEKAFELAARCNVENASDPLVGAVVVCTNGRVEGASRNEDGVGSHAEQLALLKLDPGEAAGATVYTTLEPCTVRGAQSIPCAKLLSDDRVSEVVIGILDPNPYVLGTGILELRKAGIAVRLFPVGGVARLEVLNREFIRSFPKRYLTPLGGDLTGTWDGEYTLNGSVICEEIRVKQRSNGLVDGTIKSQSLRNPAEDAHYRFIGQHVTSHVIAGQTYGVNTQIAGVFMLWICSDGRGLTGTISFTHDVEPAVVSVNYRATKR